MESVDSAFQNVDRAPDIPVYAIMVAYSQDPSPVKLNLGIGVYRQEDGKPHSLNVVRKAEKLLLDDKSMTKEYLPITGLTEFNKLSAELVFGADSPVIIENRVATVQCLSGSGSLRIGAEFLAKHHHQHIVYLSQPTYANHPNFFLAAGHALRTYRYYDPTTHGLDFKGLLEDIGEAPSGAIVLLQSCSHNPTGVDPTLEQWEKIRQLIRLKGLIPFFDCAYQGFVSGNLKADAQSIQMFVADGGECLVAQSYSKIMGIYCERVGALSIVCKTADIASRVNSQLKLVIRPMYSNPPIHGAAIVTTILKDRLMFAEWTSELKAMIDRISKLRQQLYDALCDRGTPGDWSHIVRQVGMYSFGGLNEDQVAFMKKEYHIYTSPDGRINMAGLGAKTVPHLANAIHAAVTMVNHEMDPPLSGDGSPLPVQRDPQEQPESQGQSVDNLLNVDGGSCGAESEHSSSSSRRRCRTQDPLCVENDGNVPPGFQRKKAPVIPEFQGQTAPSASEFVGSSSAQVPPYPHMVPAHITYPFGIPVNVSTLQPLSDAPPSGPACYGNCAQPPMDFTYWASSGQGDGTGSWQHRPIPAVPTYQLSCQPEQANWVPRRSLEYYGEMVESFRNLVMVESHSSQMQADLLRQQASQAQMNLLQGQNHLSQIQEEYSREQGRWAADRNLWEADRASWEANRASLETTRDQSVQRVQALQTANDSLRRTLCDYEEAADRDRVSENESLYEELDGPESLQPQNYSLQDFAWCDN